MSFLSRDTYTGNGSTTDYTVSFSYLDETHVKVYINGVLKTVTTDYTWVNSTTIRMNSAPASGVAISIQRSTSQAARLVDYVSGSSLNESDLDTDSLQAFYLAQEAIDGTGSDEALEAQASATVAAASAAAAAASALASGTRPPQGRLSIQSGTPVQTDNRVADVETIYWCPYEGNTYPWYDGASWTIRAVSELSMATDGYAAAHIGYHADGYLFDLFLYNDGGTDRLVSGPLYSGTSWDTGQVRSAAISRLDGIWVNSAVMTARFGNAAGNYITIPANRGTYVGTAFSYANGVPGSPGELGGQLNVQFGSPTRQGFIGLWNCYNRVPFSCVMQEPTDSWAYTTNAWRHLNNSFVNLAYFMTGVVEDTVSAVLQYNVDAPAIAAGITLSIGHNSLTVPATEAVPGLMWGDGDGQYGQVHAFADIVPAAGLNYVVALEYGRAGSDVYGDDGDPASEQGAFVVRGMY